MCSASSGPEFSSSRRVTFILGVVGGVCAKSVEEASPGCQRAARELIEFKADNRPPL